MRTPHHVDRPVSFLFLWHTQLYEYSDKIAATFTQISVYNFETTGIHGHASLTPCHSHSIFFLLAFAQYLFSALHQFSVNKLSSQHAERLIGTERKGFYNPVTQKKSHAYKLIFPERKENNFFSQLVGQHRFALVNVHFTLRTIFPRLLFPSSLDAEFIVRNI
jgi:hypothetical protein